MQNCCCLWKITIHLFATVSTKCFLCGITLKPASGCSEPACSLACACMCVFIMPGPCSVEAKKLLKSVPLFSGVYYGPWRWILERCPFICNFKDFTEGTHSSSYNKKSMKYPTKGGGGADLKLCVDPRHAALLGDGCFVGKLCRRLAGDWSDFYL